MSVPTPILQYNLSDVSVKGLLPSGYTPLAYIESTTAGEYIDTGFIYSSGNMTVDCEYTVPFNNSATIFGCSNDDSNWLLLICRSANINRCFCGTIRSSWTNEEVPGNKRKITYSISGTTCIFNDGKQDVSASCGTIPAQNLSYTLWCHHKGTSFTQKAQNARIYYFRLIYLGNLTLDYRPARRDSDGVIGMYDLVSRTFKTNSGSGAFIAGPELAVGKGGGKSLPEEYLLVEYLESEDNVNCYINTGFAPNNNTRLITSIYPTSTLTNAHFWFGSRNGSSTSQAFGLYQSGVATGSLSAAWNTSGNVGISQSGQKWYNIDFNKNVLTINNATARTFTEGTFTGTYPIFLFAMNTSGNMDGLKGGQRIQNTKIYDNGTIVRNMIPCYHKSDMKPGMYDTVNDIFYTNAGSGEFILGPSITNTYTWEPNSGSGTLLGLYTDLSGIYDSSKGWVADFNGSSSYIEVPWGNEQSIKNKTIGFWIKITANADDSKLICGSNHGSNLRFYFGQRNSTFSFGFGYTGWSPNYLAPIDSNWHHLMISVNSSGVATLYYDGKITLTKTADFNLSGNICLGSANKFESRFTGQISNFMIFDTALTEAQVKELYGG